MNRGRESRLNGSPRARRSRVIGFGRHDVDLNYRESGFEWFSPGELWELYTANACLDILRRKLALAVVRAPDRDIIGIRIVVKESLAFGQSHDRRGPR
jgi:hypothetical protein